VTDSKKKNHDENLFQIMDGIISQLNKTKKMFIIMILTLLILPPISFVITFCITRTSNVFGGGTHSEGFGRGFGRGFGLARAVPILIFLIWLGIGIRQWLVLSKWTKKYELYKELQKKIDEKLDYDTNGGNAEQ